MESEERRWTGRDAFELALTLLAAISGSLAAVGAFRSDSTQERRIELDVRPAIHLTCAPDFRAVDLAEGIRPTEQTALLTRRGIRWIHATSNGRDGALAPFARCTLTNFGRLPVFDVQLPMELAFPERNATRHVATSLDVPGLASGGAFTFAMMNGANGDMHFTFEPNAQVVRVDTGEAAPVRLFTDQSLLDLQARTVHSGMPATTGAATGATIVDIRDFAFAPARFRVRRNATVTFVNDDSETHTVTTVGTGFDSGPLDPDARWTHRFTRTGTYRYICSVHPYMTGTVEVTDEP